MIRGRIRSGANDIEDVSGVCSYVACCCVAYDVAMCVGLAVAIGVVDVEESVGSEGWVQRYAQES